MQPGQRFLFPSIFTSFSLVGYTKFIRSVYKKQLLWAVLVELHFFLVFPLIGSRKYKVIHPKTGISEKI